MKKLSILISLAKDIPNRCPSQGCYVAQCPELGIVSQGNSAQHALQMIGEALAITVADDIKHGFDSFDRNKK